jgi:hypothetical protein
LPVALNHIFLSTTSTASFSIEFAGSAAVPPAPAVNIAPRKPIAISIYNATEVPIKVTAGMHSLWIPQLMGDIIPLEDGIYSVVITPDKLHAASFKGAGRIHPTVFLEGEILPRGFPMTVALF